MRTQQQILERIGQVADDFFGFQRNDLLGFLDYKHAKPFLKDETTKDEWENDGREKRDPREIMIDYMDFAWDKANSKRGLSAARSMDHYTSWLWLDGDEELHKTLSDYQFYGKPQLIEICEYLGLDAEKWDDGIRENS